MRPASWRPAWPTCWRCAAAAQWLGARPVLGQDVFARGAPEDHTEIDRSGLLLGMPGLLRAYLAALRRGGGTAALPAAPADRLDGAGRARPAACAAGQPARRGEPGALPPRLRRHRHRTAGRAGEHPARRAGTGARRCGAAATRSVRSARCCCARPCRWKVGHERSPDPQPRRRGRRSDTPGRGGGRRPCRAARAHAARARATRAHATRA